MTHTADLITTPFRFASTAAEVVEGIDLGGTRAIVTGAASGIGVETARALTGAGAEVTLAVRDTDAGARTAADIAATTAGDAPRVERLDLSDRASVAAFVVPLGRAAAPARQQRGRHGDSDADARRRRPRDAVLDEPLRALPPRAGPARRARRPQRRAHRVGVVERPPALARRPRRHRLPLPRVRPVRGLRPVEDRERAVRGRADRAVGGRRHHGERPHAGRDRDELQRHMDPDHIQQRIEESGGTLRLKTVEQGAATSVLLVTSPLLEGIGGRYFEDCNEAAVIAERRPDTTSGVAPYALDAENADRLWEASLRMLG